ncbi:MAG: hypothetical protein J7L15_03695 [Clostridiales bacterium]|nr:hypothetical protein [Clostridiales bacterium]
MRFKYIIPVLFVAIFFTTACFNQEIETISVEKNIEQLACSVGDTICWWKLIKQEADPVLCQYLSSTQDQEICFSYCNRIKYENLNSFDDCTLLKVETDQSLCQVNILKNKDKTFCDNLQQVQLCKDIIIWQNASNIKNCDIIIDEDLKGECLAAFGDSQAEYDMLDLDHDGLSNLKEVEIGTDPKRADTDGDGFNDGIEVQNGFDPLKK